MPPMRKPIVSGISYSNDKARLCQQIDSCILESKNIVVQGRLQAIIVPHAGLAQSGRIAGAAYRLLLQKLQDGQTFHKIILLGPSHQDKFMGTALAREDFLTPLGRVRAGKDSLLAALDEIIDLPQVHAQDHSIEMQLPFLQRLLPDFEIYPLLLGEQDDQSILNLVQALEEFIDEETVIVVSSDLSHYLEYSAAKEKDWETIKNIQSGNVNGIEACGYEAIRALMLLAKNLGWVSIFLDYANSADTTGNRKQVVGYGAIAFIR